MQSQTFNFQPKGESKDSPCCIEMYISTDDSETMKQQY